MDKYISLEKIRLILENTFNQPYDVIYDPCGLVDNLMELLEDEAISKEDIKSIN